MKTEENLTDRYQSQSVQNPANMTNAMARTARTPSVMSRVRARREGRPTLIRGPVGPPPRSGIWKANVRTSKFAVVFAVSSGSSRYLRAPRS
ncbi:hypothetical protein GCM10010329_01250 [Streptomyces spiroverticillatus]|uniref:Uncharacterized protein n=1 Tax=Streptomyces finlayi TaxID=67296 RepID=A0A919C678_9ACTN|nr:hypothetical protein GCM10010329_01250 [Streptomyces spiroverticillatus]GHC77060.1 hypothetical protein GCM10010334_01240 [Streptomyces finlayi]